MCRYERRNTTTIRVLVILIIWVISLLTVYMLFLMCLDPLLNKRRAAYQEHVNEEVNLVRTPFLPARSAAQHLLDKKAVVLDFAWRSVQGTDWTLPLRSAETRAFGQRGRNSPSNADTAVMSNLCQAETSRKCCTACLLL